MYKITTIPGIREIYAMDMTAVSPNAEKRSAIGLPVFFDEINFQIPLVSDPECLVKWNFSRNGKGKTVELTFETPDIDLDLSEDTVFVIVDAYGALFLIGRREPPYPRITVEKRTGTPTKKRVREYKVTYPGGLLPL